jgi:hypothetical protein
MDGMGRKRTERKACPVKGCTGQADVTEEEVTVESGSVHIGWTLLSVENCTNPECRSNMASQ